jgi:DNA-binding PadR family transcriptional regulator
MPRSKRDDPQTPAGNGLREAILGLLAIRPMSGYDLSRSYQRALQQIWYAPLGQVYPTLRKMRAEKLLRVTVQVQHDRPNRKVYSLTTIGRRVFVEWLSLPAVLPNMHHEFIHKLFLLNQIDRPSRVKLVQDYVERCTAWAAELRQIDRKLEASLDGPHGESALYQQLALRHLRRIVECEAQSAKTIAREIAAMPAAAKTRRPGKRFRTGASAPHAAFAGLSLSPEK